MKNVRRSMQMLLVDAADHSMHHEDSHLCLCLPA